MPVPRKVNCGWKMSLLVPGHHGIALECLDVPVIGRVGEDATDDLHQFSGDVRQPDRRRRARPIDQLLTVGRLAVIAEAVELEAVAGGVVESLNQSARGRGCPLASQVE
jgi:hypothetical protein